VTLPLARNAQAILQARLRGLKPDEMVMVSLVGRIESGNQTVFARWDDLLDWRWVRGLDICVRIGDEPTWAGIVKAIALQRPDYLCLWHETQRWGVGVYLVPTAADVAKPVRLWSYELDFLEWLDFQNRDFIEGRTYERDDNGIPYESHPRQHRLQRLHGGAGAVPHHSSI
jgi:GNAT superfamily N-acetyltransferase